MGNLPEKVKDRHAHWTDFLAGLHGLTQMNTDAEE